MSIRKPESDPEERIPDWSNPIAVLLERVNGIDSSSVWLYEQMPEDGEDYGEVSALCLRYLGRIHQLHLASLQFQEGLKVIYDMKDTENAVRVIDAAERDLDVLVGLYTQHLEHEVQVLGRKRRKEHLPQWRGLPLFTIRAGGIAVVRAQDQRLYERHLHQRPYRPINTHLLYRRIAIESIRPKPEDHLPAE